MTAQHRSLPAAWQRACALLRRPDGAERYREEIKAHLAELPGDLLREIAGEAARLLTARAEIARRREAGIPLSEELEQVERERREG